MRGPRKLGMRVRKLVFLCFRVIRKDQNLNNAVLCEDRFAKTDALYAHLAHRRTRSSW